MTVWLCYIPHSYALLRRRIAPSSMVCPSVFLSLCQYVTLVSPAKKTAETIKLPFAFWTRVGPLNHVLHEVQDANMGRGNFEGETGKPL